MNPSHLQPASPLGRLGSLLILSATILAATPASAQATGSLVWSSGPDLPSPRTECAAVLASDNAVLLFGGESPAGQKVVPKLSNEAGAWTTAPLPVALSGACAVGVGATHIHVFGGETATGIQGSVYLYNIAADSWSAIAPLLTPVRDAAAALFEDRIYVLEGNSPTGPVDSVQIFDLTTGLWSTDALPAARHGHAAVVTASGKILVAGGFDAADAPSWKFRERSASWPTSK